MAKQPRSIAGRVVAITGGARGIGRATAEALAREGARARSATSTPTSRGGPLRRSARRRRRSRSTSPTVPRSRRELAPRAIGADRVLRVDGTERRGYVLRAARSEPALGPADAPAVSEARR